ncbi:MAG TPA: restriction endonuclease subunit S [Ruminococcus sp.]|nr:restriction endonuclease subunit S [Ruminococcus sp.]
MTYRQIKLGEVASVIRGVSYKSSDYSSADDIDAEAFINLKCVTADGFRQDGVKYFNGKHKPSQSVYAGDLLIANTDLTRNREVIGNSILVPELNRPNACFSMDLSKIEITDNSVLDREFLYYYLKSPKARWYMINHSDGSTVVHLPTSATPELEIDLPDLETQKKIVRVLSALDQKIELNHKISNNLLRISHQVYLKEIKGAATARTEKLGRLCRIKYGKGLPASKVIENGYRVYGGNGIIGFYNEKMYDESQVLISCRGAASGKVIFTRPECFVTNNSLILECDEKYHYFVKEYSLDREYYDYTTGSAQPQITIDNIKDVELPLPNDEVLIKFNNTLRPIEKKYFAILDENEALAKLRDILLPKLMSNEISLEKAVMELSRNVQSENTQNHG